MVIVTYDVSHIIVTVHLCVRCHINPTNHSYIINICTLEEQELYI